LKCGASRRMATAVAVDPMLQSLREDSREWGRCSSTIILAFNDHWTGFGHGSGRSLTSPAFQRGEWIELVCVTVVPPLQCFCLNVLDGRGASALARFVLWSDPSLKCGASRRMAAAVAVDPMLQSLREGSSVKISPQESG
jgi:hypothetical protein